MYSRDSTKRKRRSSGKLSYRSGNFNTATILWANSKFKQQSQGSQGLLISTFKSAFQGSEPKKTKLKMRETLKRKDSNCLQLSKQRQGRKIALLMTPRVCWRGKERKSLNRKSQVEILNKNLQWERWNKEQGHQEKTCHPLVLRRRKTQKFN